MKTSAAFLIAATMALAGCSALEQAPLVYASKVTYGVDLSATSTETPGVSLTVGYKQVDAAYVPIAVAKKCESTNPKDCTNSIYQLMPINGEASIADSRTPSSTEIDAQKSREQFAQAVLEEDSARKALTASKAAFSNAIARKEELTLLQEIFTTETNKSKDISSQVLGVKARTPANGSPTPADSVELQTLEAKLAAIKIVPFSTAEQDELKNIGNVIAAANDALIRDTRLHTEKKLVFDKLSPDAKLAERFMNNLARKDSYSVYGRFQASVVGGAQVAGAAANVGLGKVFSTGVASQALTHGLGEYYKSLGTAACFDAVARVKTAQSTDSDVRTWIQECRSEIRRAN